MSNPLDSDLASNDLLATIVAEAGHQHGLKRSCEVRAQKMKAAMGHRGTRLRRPFSWISAPGGYAASRFQ